VGVTIEDVGVVQVPEGDVPCASCNVEDVLRFGIVRVGGEAGREGGYEVVPELGRHRVSQLS